MGNNNLFFSIRWKLAALFGGLFLLLQSVFALMAYLNAHDHFDAERKKIQDSHVKMIETLTEDSFQTLEQFAELVSFVNQPMLAIGSDKPAVINSLDENWARWQLVWGMENIVYFDKQGREIKSWGDTLPIPKAAAQQVLNTESPEHHVFCTDKCYQQVVIPVLLKSDIVGVLSIVRSFSDTIIKYKHATGHDVGILIAEKPGQTPGQAASPGKVKNTNPHSRYHLGAMTLPEKNVPLFDFIAKRYKIELFQEEAKRVESNGATYEILALPIIQSGKAINPPMFLFIDDITGELLALNEDLKRIWLWGFLGLLASLLFIFCILHYSLRRVAVLAKALPMLSQNQFTEFKALIPPKDSSNLGYDELDNLGYSALALAEQLEHFDQEMRGQTINLLEKSRELARERDFIRQLIELAPIIIVIQRMSGIILNINQAGVESLEADVKTVIGKVFDVYLPDEDKEHAAKLARLRSGLYSDLLQIDGQIVTEAGKTKDVSWLHKLLPAKAPDEERVILTLGLDISERKIAEARNIRMAYYDFLTGLGNRRKFQEEFTQRLASAERYHYQLALLYLDLDRFKEINDTSGHEAGDNFLKMVSSVLKGAVRSTDLLCRIGGDEFTLLLPHAEVDGVEHMANKINDVLTDLVFSTGGKDYRAGASIGIAIFPLHGTTVNELIANADLAMYQAKEQGRGQFHMFDPTYDYRSKANQTFRWRKIFEDAFENDRFVLFYQPIMTIKSNNISHFECLVRLQQEDGKLLMPSDFVARAEELGMISQIDRIVVKKAAEQLVEFGRQGKKYRLTVNISKRSFEDPAIFDDFAEIFSNPEVDQKRIIFEITDTSAVSSYHSTNALIAKIKSLGCVLALNDFGVEYPSLHYLKNAPVDYVKIDGSLIRQLDKNEDDKVFVKALIEMAQSFGKKTVAEFVENEDILAILREFGIDYVQGYHIGKPEAIEPVG